MKKLCLTVLFCSIHYLSMAQVVLFSYLIINSTRDIKSLKRTFEGDTRSYNIVAPQQSTIFADNGDVLQGTVNMRESYSGKTFLFRASTKGAFKKLDLRKIQRVSIYGADTLLCTNKDSTHYYRFPEVSRSMWRELVSSKDGSFKLFDSSVISNEREGYLEVNDMLVYHNGKYKKIGFWATFPKRYLTKQLNKILNLNLNKKDFRNTAGVVVWLKNYFQKN